jgi:hypothetical protein
VGSHSLTVLDCLLSRGCVEKIIACAAEIRSTLYLLEARAQFDGREHAGTPSMAATSTLTSSMSVGGRSTSDLRDGR